MSDRIKSDSLRLIRIPSCPNVIGAITTDPCKDKDQSSRPVTHLRVGDQRLLTPQEEASVKILREFLKKKFNCWEAFLTIRPEIRLAFYAICIVVMITLAAVFVVKLVNGDYHKNVGEVDTDVTVATPAKGAPWGTSQRSVSTHPTRRTTPGDSRGNGERVRNFTVIDSLKSLNDLPESVRTVVVNDLRGWPMEVGNESSSPRPITCSAPGSGPPCPSVIKMTVTASVSESTLSQLLHAFAATLEGLELDMAKICLGAQVDKAQILNIPKVSLPVLKRLTLRYANTCLLRMWVLGWGMPQCTTIKFCSTPIDDGVFEMLKNITSRRSVHLELFDSPVCSGCTFGGSPITSLQKCPTK